MNSKGFVILAKPFSLVKSSCFWFSAPICFQISPGSNPFHFDCPNFLLMNSKGFVILAKPFSLVKSSCFWFSAPICFQISVFKYPFSNFYFPVSVLYASYLIIWILLPLETQGEGLVRKQKWHPFSGCQIIGSMFFYFPVSVLYASYLIIWILLPLETQGEGLVRKQKWHPFSGCQIIGSMFWTWFYPKSSSD